MVFLAFQCGDHLFNKVVDIKDLKFHFRVIDRDRQVVGNVVAERCDGAVIVRTAPFAIEIGEPIHKNFYSIFLTIPKEEVFTGFLAASIFAVAKTTGKGCLRRT